MEMDLYDTEKQNDTVKPIPETSFISLLTGFSTITLMSRIESGY